MEQAGRLPDALVACVGGGSNAIGMFHPSLVTRSPLRCRGQGAKGFPGNTVRPCAAEGTGVLHGTYTYLIQDAFGQILESHSISAGLDYPGVGPEHSYLHDAGRVDLPAGD